MYAHMKLAITFLTTALTGDGSYTICLPVDSIFPWKINRIEDE